FLTDAIQAWGLCGVIAASQVFSPIRFKVNELLDLVRREASTLKAIGYSVLGFLFLTLMTECLTPVVEHAVLVTVLHFCWLGLATAVWIYNCKVSCRPHLMVASAAILLAVLIT